MIVLERLIISECKSVLHSVVILPWIGSLSVSEMVRRQKATLPDFKCREYSLLLNE
jgi:hypothetical protein